MKEIFSERAEAWVLFYDTTNLWFLQGLKKNFRHCSILLIDEQIMISLDLIGKKLEIDLCEILDLPEFERQLEVEHITVLKTKIRPVGPSWFSLIPVNCVELAKRILGIRAWGVLTPYQLYKFLTRN
jgi:hypothetical protein